VEGWQTRDEGVLGMGIGVPSTKNLVSNGATKTKPQRPVKIVIGVVFKRPNIWRYPIDRWKEPV